MKYGFQSIRQFLTSALISALVSSLRHSAASPASAAPFRKIHEKQKTAAILFFSRNTAII